MADDIDCSSRFCFGPAPPAYSSRASEAPVNRVYHLRHRGLVERIPLAGSLLAIGAAQGLLGNWIPEGCRYTLLLAACQADPVREATCPKLGKLPGAAGECRRAALPPSYLAPGLAHIRIVTRFASLHTVKPLLGLGRSSRGPASTAARVAGAMRHFLFGSLIRSELLSASTTAGREPGQLAPGMTAICRTRRVWRFWNRRGSRLQTPCDVAAALSHHADQVPTDRAAADG